MDYRLAGRTALITGASKGIGFAIAQAMAAQGCNLWLISRDGESLSKAAAKISAGSKVRVTTLATDVGAPGAAEHIFKACPGADIVVNNAGSIPSGTIFQVDEAAWRASWDCKVFGYINMSRCYMAAMKERREGVIVNILGIAGELRDAAYLAGSVGNAALIAFTKAMGAWSPQFGVRVVGVSPGPVSTERLIKMQKYKALQKTGSEEGWEKALTTFPFGRAATPEEVADAVVFLASPLSAYTSGAVLNLDGGITGGRPIP
jgi:3-oxoacyl-[acyl-carrier protein] reductase